MNALTADFLPRPDHYRAVSEPPDSDADGNGNGNGNGNGDRREPAVSCELQGGTLSIYGDRVHIDRSRRSMFEDKTVPMDEIEGVEYSKGIVSGHIQIRQTGMDHDSGGFLSHPVDENTLFFPRNRRSDAREARDAILARATESGSGSGSGSPAERAGTSNRSTTYRDQDS